MFSPCYFFYALAIPGATNTEIYRSLDGLGMGFCRTQSAFRSVLGWRCCCMAQLQTCGRPFAWPCGPCLNKRSFELSCGASSSPPVSSLSPHPSTANILPSHLWRQPASLCLINPHPSIPSPNPLAHHPTHPQLQLLIHAASQDDRRRPMNPLNPSHRSS